MTDEKDNSDSDWEHLNIMNKKKYLTKKVVALRHEIDESSSDSDTKEIVEPPQEKNVEVEEHETPSAGPVKVDEDSPPQDDSVKAEECNTPQEEPTKEEDESPHENAAKREDSEPSHDDSEKKEESEPEDDLVKAKDIYNPPENHPIPGKSFMIRTRNKPNLILILKYGKLLWLDRPIPSGGHIWRCVEKDGWLGFRNMASGAYLGHNKEGKIIATQNQHKQQERFTERRKENGGYMLCIPQEPGLLKVAISEDGKSLVLQEGEGEALDFIDSKYLDSPVSLKYPNMPAQKLR